MVKWEMVIPGTWKAVFIEDGHEGKAIVCRSEYNSVEVYNEILVSTDENIESGTFIDDEIISASEFEMQGRIVGIYNG